MRYLIFILLTFQLLKINAQSLMDEHICVGKCNYDSGEIELFYYVDKNKFFLTFSDQTYKIELKESHVSKFSSEIKKLEKKYVELENIAINNDVKNFTKELDITISDKKVWFKDNSEWYTEEGVDFSSNFAVDQAGKATASLKSDRINAVTKEILSRTHHHAGLYQAKSDQYEIIKHHSDGFSISFNSAQQMSDFSEMLNNGIEKKKSILLDIKNKAQLFK